MSRVYIPFPGTFVWALWFQICWYEIGSGSFCKILRRVDTHGLTPVALKTEILTGVGLYLFSPEIRHIALWPLQWFQRSTKNIRETKTHYANMFSWPRQNAIEPFCLYWLLSSLRYLILNILAVWWQPNVHDLLERCISQFQRPDDNLGCRTVAPLQIS